VSYAGQKYALWYTYLYAFAGNAARRILPFCPDLERQELFNDEMKASIIREKERKRERERERERELMRGKI